MADWESNVREAYVTEVYQHYDSRPYFTADATVSNSMPVRGSNAMPSVTSSREMANHNNSSTNAAGATMATATSQPVEHLGGVERASKLIGMTALNMENEKLGKVENLLVDLPAGRVAEVIISTGGFLGIGGELSAVPPQSLGIGAVRDTVSLDTTKEALAAAPHYKASELSNLDNPEQVQSVYRSYHVEPYFNTNAVDNTAQNVRDRQENTMTPLDQSNTPADLDLTRQVRQQIMALKGLSVDAQNVKIITVNGRVTLRGPVNSEDEKRQIAEIVARVNPSATVDNQIEVKDSSYNHTGSNQ
jgi:sporulation protein YlmC with PRC-barrel domain